ncbi:MAG TPA: hypothetical protein DEO84_03290 [candidate division Zixibacteria bacterium]|nr:hypothetical protein [candidate division Zixibacteria bacterium]
MKYLKQAIIPLAVFLGAGFYYYHQACPTFYYWDSAELTAAVLGRGVPHPPGFPFFLILSSAWQRFLSLDPKLSLNVFSALFGALGLCFWYQVTVKVLRLLRLAKSEGIISLVSLVSVAIMGVSLTYSIQATRFEVYSLNFAGFAALTLICLSIINRETPSKLLSLGFFMLLGAFLAVHNLTIALAIPGLLLLVVWPQKMTLGNALLGTIGSFIFSGLFYLLLLFNAQSNPPLNWGDPANLGNLVDYILVKGFVTSTSRFTLSHIIAQLSFAYDIFIRQIGPAALALALFGFGYVIWKKREIGIPLTLIFGLNIVSVAFAENYFYENYDLHGYLMISLAIAIIFLAVTFLLIHNLIMSRFKGKRAEVTRALALGIFLIFAMLILAPPAKDNFRSADLSKVRGAEEYAGRFLADAPDSSVVITSSYNTYFCALAYQALFPNTRGKAVVNLYNWDHEWGRDESDRALKIPAQEKFIRTSYYSDFINRAKKSHPVFIEYDQSSAPIARYLIPRGMGYLFSLSDTLSDPATFAVDDPYISLSSKASDLESIRTWVLWLQSRGEYFTRLKCDKAASRYIAQIDTLASKADLQ